MLNDKHVGKSTYKIVSTSAGYQICEISKGNIYYNPTLYYAHSDAKQALKNINCECFYSGM